MPRVAWFTPLPPTRSGIADYSAELLPLLAGRCAIDVFTTSPIQDDRRWAVPVHSAFDFSWQHLRRPFDLIVYQLGNATCHAFMWPYLFRHPGLVVLHDAQLHHSRGLALLPRGRTDDYRAEFRANHPDARPDGCEMVVADLAGFAYYYWPMVRLVARASRLVAVHSPRLADDLAEQHTVETTTIRMGVGDPHEIATDAATLADTALATQTSRSRGRVVRDRYGIPADALVFAAFGLVTPEKRISQILQALRGLPRTDPPAHLLLVGGTADHYDARAEARALGVADRVTITGYVPDHELGACLDAADVCVCLRWPTGRETSASWLRALAAERPTIVTELAHTDDVPSLDPRTWAVQPAGSGPEALARDAEPVCIAIDILDEVHSLGLAMRRLTEDASLRERLGLAARAHWKAQHTLSCMADDYLRAIARAIEKPAPRLDDLPRHLRADGTEQVREMADNLGVRIDFLTQP